MQAHVEERELELAQRLQAGLEAAGGDQLALLVLGRARRKWRGTDLREHFRQPGVVFHDWLGSSTASQATPLMPAMLG